MGGIPAGFESLQSSVAPGGFETLVGPIYRHSDVPEGISIWGFHAEARHCNPFGRVHGGMLTTLADTMMGSVVFRAIGDATCATISLTTDFVSAGRMGDWIEGRAELLRLGRSVAFVRAQLRVKDQIIMSAQGSWAIIQPPSARG